MNRRDFAKSISAAVAAPLIPAQSLFASALPSGTYKLGAMLARAHNSCSPAMLARHLKLDAQAASALYNSYLTDGIIAPAGRFGISRAINPLAPHLAPAPPTPASNTPTTNAAPKPDLTNLALDRDQEQPPAETDTCADSFPPKNESPSSPLKDHG